LSLSFEEALADILSQVTSLMGENGDALNRLIVNLIRDQHALLVLGNFSSSSSSLSSPSSPPTPPHPSSFINRNGIAYLEGWDTWSDISALADFGVTQPSRFSILDIKFGLYQKQYKEEIQPLLSAMASVFTNYAEALAKLSTGVPSYIMPLLQEILDSMNITALRAVEVAALYEAVSPSSSPSRSAKMATLAKETVIEAQDVIARRESQYRVPLERIAGWRYNPTVYNYGYLWTVHSAYYFKRDFFIATADNTTVLSPCFMNIISPADVVIGEGGVNQVLQFLQELGDKYGYGFIADCLHAPESEPNW
jgi:hypothetical protein